MNPTWRQSTMNVVYAHSNTTILNIRPSRMTKRGEVHRIMYEYHKTKVAKIYNQLTTR